MLIRPLKSVSATSVSRFEKIMSYISTLNSNDCIDTAQSYRNEKETGTALANSGLPRDDVFITTKYSGRDGLDINASIHNSVKFVSNFIHIFRVNLNLSFAL